MPYVDGHFGNCPICHTTDGFLNVWKENWFHCQRHKLRWCVGMGLFSWPDDVDIEKASRANADWLRDCAEITLDETWDPPEQVAETLIQKWSDPGFMK